MADYLVDGDSRKTLARQYTTPERRLPITICLDVDIYKYMDLNEADPANATSLALQQPCRV
jgi:hypothetical protein